MFVRYNVSIMKFLAAFGLILLYMGLWVPVILLGVAFLDDDMMLFFIFGLLLFLVPTFPLVVDRIGKLLYRFPALNPNPISEDELRKLLFAMNTFDAPVTVMEKGKKMIFTWKYVDAKWYEIMRKVGKSSTYRLLVKLDAKRHRATLIDIETSMNWSISPTKFRFHASFFRGIDVMYKREIDYAINEAFQPGKVVDYRFTNNEIKDPVMNTIREAGWDVRFGLF